MQNTGIKSLLIRKYNQPVPRYTSYPTVPFWEDEIDPKQWQQVFAKQFHLQNPEKGISIYDPKSYFSNPKKSEFTKEDILNYKKQINKLNADNQGSTAVFYIQKSA